MEDYTSLTKNKRFIGNFPVTFTEKAYDSKFEYYYTPKLDGLRKLLFIHCGKAYSITIKNEFSEVKLTKNISKLNNVLLDTEFYKGKYYAFDILFYGTDLRKKKLTERLEILREIVSIVKSKKLIEKEYKKLSCNEFLKDIKEADTYFRSGKLDGFILTPDSEYSSKVLKWKPNYLLSIDFAIKNEGDSLVLLLQNKEPFTPKGFNGRIKYPLNFKKFNDGDVVEFTYIEGEFKILRLRPDKIKSNHISVVLDNYRELKNPTDIKSVLGKC